MLQSATPLPCHHRCNVVSATCDISSAGLYSCIVKTVMQVNDARKLMFSHSLRSLDSIAPTKITLFQHIKRALVVAAFIWKQSLSKTPEIPKPSEWGWEWNTRKKSGYHIGQICRTSARRARWSSTVAVVLTVIKLYFLTPSNPGRVHTCNR